MVVDLTPLLRGVRGDAFRIAGVVVGDRAANVDRAALTGAQATAFLVGQIYGDDTVFRTGPDGAKIELPLAERIAAVIENGGRLRSGEIELRAPWAGAGHDRVGGGAVADGAEALEALERDGGRMPTLVRHATSVPSAVMRSFARARIVGP
jgi:hypothetical protein